MGHNFQTFLQMNERRIYFQIQRLQIRHEEVEEYYTEGLVALWQAYQEYDQAKGNVGTFINYKIRFKLLDLLRKKIRQQEKDEYFIEEEKKSLSNGNHIRHTTSPLPSMTDECLRQTYTYQADFWKMVRKELTEKQWKWVKYYIIAELSIKEIMEIENVSADAVKGWRRGVRDKLNKPSIQAQLRSYLSHS